MLRSAGTSFALSMLVLGCGSSAGAPPDAGTEDAEAPVDGEAPRTPLRFDEVRAPAEPSGVVLGSCLLGDTLGPEGRCEPPDLGRCERSQLAFPGSGGCVAISRPCPEGPFPSASLSQALYVLAGSAGDGSREAPLGTLGEAIERVTPGATIVLGKGRYRGAFVLPAGVSLEGACASETILEGTLDVPTLTVDQGSATLRHVTFEGGGGIVVLGAETTLELEALVLESPSGYGVFVDSGATLRAHRLVVRGLTPDSATNATAIAVVSGVAEIDSSLIEGGAAYGIGVTRAGTLALDGVRIRGAGDDASRTAIQFEGGLEARALLVERYRSGLTGLGAEGRGHVVDSQFRSSEGAEGRGVQLGEGATLSLERILVSDTGNLGVLSNGTLSMQHVVVAHAGYRGVSLGGATASTTLASVEIEDVHESGLRVAEGEAVVSDLVVRDVGAGPDGYGGFGILVRDGAHVELQRSLTERGTSVGVLAAEGGVLIAHDVTVRDTRPEAATGFLGSGIVASEDAQAIVERALVEDCHDAAVAALESGALTATDLTVLRTRERADGFHGFALLAFRASAMVHRARFHDTRSGGAVAVDGGSLVLDDVNVSEVQVARADVGGMGFAISALTGGSVDLRNVRAESNFGAGIAALGRGARVTGEAVEVEDTRGGECMGCDVGGLGVAALEEGHVDLRGALVRASSLCGLYLDDVGTMSVADGLVTECEIGACVADGASLRDVEEVRYVDNGRALDALHLPVPSPMFLGLSE